MRQVGHNNKNLKRQTNKLSPKIYKELPYTEKKGTFLHPLDEPTKQPANELTINNGLSITNRQID